MREAASFGSETAAWEDAGDGGGAAGREAEDAEELEPNPKRAKKAVALVEVDLSFPLSVDLHFPVIKIAEQPTCVVCFSDIEVDESCRTTQCDHAFHADCLLHWWTHKPNPWVPLLCPLCQTPQRQMAMDNGESKDTFAHLVNEEADDFPRPEYMDSQVCINATMREILIDWLVDVHLKFHLRTRTLFLTVTLIDRFLEKQQVAKEKLQLVGITSLLIAAKFGEMSPPDLKTLAWVTDHTYTPDEIVEMEVAMLEALKFKICYPTAGHFLIRFQGINDCADFHLIQYLLELSLLCIKMIQYKPSHLVASAVFLCNKLLELDPAWSEDMVRQTTYSEPSIKACAKEMYRLFLAAEHSKRKAVRRKFSRAQFGGVGMSVYGEPPQL